MRRLWERAGAALVRPAPLGLVGALALAGALVLTGALSVPGAAPTASALGPFPPDEATTPQTDASVPASEVTLIGATPEEPGAPGRYETWGVGGTAQGKALLRYYLHPGPRGEEGSWAIDQELPSGFQPEGEGPLFGEMTPRGAGVLAGETGGRQVALVRRPGGAFEETKAVENAVEGKEPVEGDEPALKEGEALFSSSRAPLIAPLEEEDGQTGALVAPVNTGSGEAVEDQVLHWDGRKWSSEPIEVPAESGESLRVLALGASSPGNAWLLVQLAQHSSYPAGAVALFRRMQVAGQWRWQPVALGAAAGDGKAHPLTVPVQGAEPEPFTVPGVGSPPKVKGQILTVTSEGVWIDGERADVHVSEPASTTMFFKPAPEGAAAGSVLSSWCELPQTAPAGTPLCLHALPEALPTGYSRSIAWANGTVYGERVITGLPEGVSLRLEGESFTRVLALGGGHEPFEDPGSQLGAAFSEPTEGWLGESGPPVHLTTKPSPSELTPWPTPFRHPLLAIAPEPGAPVGALSSEALAVGTEGAVARYKPGEGWLPETLFGPGERVERDVRLRAVAWPTPARAYAVGDHGQMWLWRGETGLWERDPATPLNFRGNLLGIAFDPENPAIGYAVGSTEVGLGGVLLRYGKTWTEETALPPEVQGAAFTSIAFAGSEAIVAYSKQVNLNENRFVGGLLVNEGSGWHVDGEAAAAIGSGVPQNVAGLPDGGAAFTTTGGAGARVYERQQAGAPWRETPTPLSGNGGQLTLFREGGALRALVAGGGVGSLALQEPPPPGSPPDLYPPVGEQSPGVAGAVLLRQTATGWSDESHEADPVKQPAGGYTGQDLPYRPDPILAVLIDAEGRQGWAVGGSQGSGGLQTGDIERYPAEGSPPLGLSEATVGLDPQDATFAVGGDAECEDPCAARARAGVGPQVWLTAALGLARRIGVRAFLDTGPSVTKGLVEGTRSLPLPFARELEETASILAPSPPLAPAYVAAARQDLAARPESEGAETAFAQAFAGFPQAALSAADGGEQGCDGTVGCQTAYYSFLSEGTGPAVRVIVLDESGEVDQGQLAWLEGQLADARASGTPAIVLGSADLNAQLAANQVQAKEVARALEEGEASAYFYDSPEENVQQPLRWGAEKVPVFGSGTLGYASILKQQGGSFHGAGGILLTQVGAREPGGDRAPVTARLVPVIGELALEAKGGTLLRRSEPALFEALARRPRAGSHTIINSNEPEEDPYIQIPEECVGKECSSGLFPEYTFTSSDKEVGQFVEHNRAAAGQPLAVLQNAKGEPIPDEPVGEVNGQVVNERGEAIPREQSGLFCPYFQGTTVVTIETGGLKSSLPVTVQAGSVRQPCGTVPQKHRVAAAQTASAPAPPPAPAPAPAGPAPASAPPVVPVPPPPLAVTPPPARPAPAPAPFFIQPALPFVAVAFVPPPLPAPAEPTPPTGTSAVTSPVEAAQKEEEEEEATESVSNQALAYHAPEHEPSPVYALGIVILAAFAGASVRRRPRRGRRELRVAPATLSSTRAQRRMDWVSRRGR